MLQKNGGFVPRTDSIAQDDVGSVPRTDSIAQDDVGSVPRTDQKTPLSPFQISFTPTIKAILQDMTGEVPVAHISAKFHNTLARVILTVAERAKQEHNIDTVVLTGGVFLNKRLLTTTLNLLDRKGFKAVRPTVYSPNDESISVGQIAYALNLLQADFDATDEE
jgi:hydrogenase maturation factor HypF (carbamoyltransferase family)